VHVLSGESEPFALHAIETALEKQAGSGVTMSRSGDRLLTRIAHRHGGLARKQSRCPRDLILVHWEQDNRYGRVLQLESGRPIEAMHLCTSVPLVSAVPLEPDQLRAAVDLAESSCESVRRRRRFIIY
jgi:hypothetical protein